MCSGTSSLGSATSPSGNSGKSRTRATRIQSRPGPVSRAMAGTALVWFRRDLRVHDHPPLRAALDAHEAVVPVFVLEDKLLDASPSRTAFMLECLRELRAALDGKLVVARGPAERELVALARAHAATAVYFASDVSPFARARDERAVAALREAG